MSAIANSFKLGNNDPIINKRTEIEEVYEDTNNMATQLQYQRNIEILSNYEDYDVSVWRPVKEITLITKRKEETILTINGLPVEVKPHHIYWFQQGGVKRIGAIWFVAKLKRFNVAELGMFTEMLYRHLNKHYSEEYVLSEQNCMVVDVINMVEVTFAQLQDKSIPRILSSTLNEIKRFW